MLAAVILAAGSSTRLGRPKQLLDFRGRPLVQHAIDTAAVCDEVVVVLGHAAEEVQAAITLPSTGHIVHNPEHASGQASSLRAGLEALTEDVGAALVLLGDQPGVSAEAVKRVIDVYEQTGGPVVQARYGDAPGHPVLFDRSVWAQLTTIEGDRGARDLLRAHPEWVVPVRLGAEPPPDVDTWADYERLQRGE
jgi:molybdenum cofactor cytidylyltransferase